MLLLLPVLICMPCLVDGHASKLVCGQFEGKSVICMVGRMHFYEGHAPAKITFPIRVLAELGCKSLIGRSLIGWSPTLIENVCFQQLTSLV